MPDLWILWNISPGYDIHGHVLLIWDGIDRVLIHGTGSEGGLRLTWNLVLREGWVVGSLGCKKECCNAEHLKLVKFGSSVIDLSVRDNQMVYISASQGKARFMKNSCRNPLQAWPLNRPIVLNTQ